MKVFTDLTRSRQAGMGIGSIPISEIKAYCEMFGISSYSERSDLLYIIGEMDDKFMTFQINKQKK